MLWADRDGDHDLVDAALERGFTQREPLAGTPEMVLTADRGGAQPSPGVELRRVTEPDDARWFADVVAVSYAIAVAPATSRAIFAEASLLLHPDVLAFGVWRDAEPVACAMVLIRERTAEIGFVGTVERMRGRGLGRLVTQTTAHAAFHRGVEAVLLQASPMGEPLYAHMGFVEIKRYLRFESPATS